MYGQEVIGRIVEIYFLNDEDDPHKGAFYRGVVKDIRSGKQVDMDDPKRSSNDDGHEEEEPYNEHFIAFDDEEAGGDDDDWFILSDKEDMNELRWPCQEQRLSDSPDRNKRGYPQNSSSMKRIKMQDETEQKGQDKMKIKKNDSKQDLKKIKNLPENMEDRKDALKTEVKVEKEKRIKIDLKKEEDDLYCYKDKMIAKYGNRVLLARQSAEGMMKLGGGNCAMDLYPSKNVKGFETHRRFREIGTDRATAYNDAWNPDGPKYAGQPYASVTRLRYGSRDSTQGVDEPFHLFMKRTHRGHVLGWEYCGKYKFTGNPKKKIFDLAYKQTQINRNFIKNDIKRSLKCPSGEWHKSIDEWIKRLNKELKDDNCPEAPQWLKEKRKPTEDEIENDSSHSLVARARALGYKRNLPKDKVVDILVWIDEFYNLAPVQFVEYDEKMYEYVKGGESTRSSVNFKRKKKKGECCVRASDFYALIED